MAIRQILATSLLLLLTVSLYSPHQTWAIDEENPQAAEAGAAADVPSDDASATPPPPPKIPPLPLDLQKGQRLAEQFAQREENKTSLQWFREGQKDAFLGLYSENYGREPQGYALILHDNQQHPDWPGLIHYLRSQLPGKGWSTLAISLPDLWHLTDAPPREIGDVVVQPAEAPSNASPGEPEPANSPSPDNDSTTPETTEESNINSNDSGEGVSNELTYTQLSVEYPKDEVPGIIQQRVTEALGFLQGRDPMPIIVIAAGSSASVVAKQVHTLRMKDIAGLVIVDAAAISLEGFQVDEDAPGLRIPVLDLVPQFSPKTDPAARLRTARRNASQTYEQQIIRSADSSFAGYEEFVTKAIRGWARRKITGKSRFGYL